MQSSYLEFAERLAREAGEVILDYFGRVDKQVQVKADTSPVTIADKKINDLVIASVAKTFPEHGVLAEEGSSHEARSSLWVCDPIDGTQGFILGVPTAMFSIAYVDNGQPKVAVAYDPFQNKMYSAMKDDGAYCNKQLIRVSGRQSLVGAIVAGMTSYRQIIERQDFYDQLEVAGAKPTVIPGNVYKAALVSTGTLDGYVFPGQSAHDIAAVKLIIEEAGGKVTDLRGNEQRYDGRIFGAIISNGHIHDQVVNLIKEYGPDKYLGH